MAFDRWPRPDDAPAPEDMARCVHCGLCLDACPTYVVTGLETESPRGRIALARGVDDGGIPLTSIVQGHWELCLQCRACEAVCPSSVPYGRIMERLRAQLDAGPPTGQRSRRVRRFLLRNVVARPRVLAAAVAPARLYAASPLRPLVRRLLRLPPLRRLRRLESQLPFRPGRPVRPGMRLPAPSDSRATSAVLFTGCVMGELFGGVHTATARILARAGIRAIAARGQACCGALHAHDGDLGFARHLARKNIAALESLGSTPIVVNSAGCGAALKEYGDLLGHDPVWAGRARHFATRVRDLSEYLRELNVSVPASYPARVAYQDACHLAHAQRIRQQPRDLLRAVDGCELIETPGADVCCGAAGLYSLVQPTMSARLRSRKAAGFHDAGADVIVTANPGCHLQYLAAVDEAGIGTRVLHLAEFLDAAQTNAQRGPG